MFGAGATTTWAGQDFHFPGGSLLLPPPFLFELFISRPSFYRGKHWKTWQGILCVTLEALFDYVCSGREILVRPAPTPFLPFPVPGLHLCSPCQQAGKMTCALCLVVWTSPTSPRVSRLSSLHSRGIMSLGFSLLSPILTLQASSLENDII